MLPRLFCLKELNRKTLTGQFKAQIAFASSGCKLKQNDEKLYQRDLVNFPRPKRLEYSPPCVFGFLPKSWFDFFYKKTGVTGGYTLLFGVAVYLFSKEIVVFNPEFGNLLAGILALFIIQRYIPEIKEYNLKIMKEHDDELNFAQNENKRIIKENIEELENSKSQSKYLIQMIPEAKRENVYLQMEAAYRENLRKAHSAVLNALKYNAEKNQIELYHFKKNLISWVLNKVNTSITPEIKKRALENAISDLKKIQA